MINKKKPLSIKKFDLSDPRFYAFCILDEFDEKFISIDVILEIFEENHLKFVKKNKQKLSRQDRSLFNALLYGVLRWRGRLDWIIEKFSNRPVKDIDAQILNILRIGVFQIFFMDRVPDFAAINTSVDMTKKISKPRVSGFVNGMLRNIVRKKEAVQFTIQKNCNAKEIADLKSYPEWLINRWLQRLGGKETIALCDAGNRIPLISIRINIMRISVEKILSEFSSRVESIQKLKYSPLGLSFSRPEKKLSEMPGFNEGWFQVQDEASQIVIYMLNPQPGEKILDACAGRGGKTGHIAQLMSNVGDILAVDQHDQRLRILSETMQKSGFTNIRTKKITWPDANFKEQFDRIIVDSPCSGLGVIRRNPETKWIRKEKDLEQYGNLQFKILSEMARLLKNDGTLVYSVCTTEIEETEAVILKFLSDHNNFRIVKELYWLPENIKKLVNKKGYLITWPHLHDMDGFFAVCFKKK